jgi:hypothetical protein
VENRELLTSLGFILHSTGRQSPELAQVGSNAMSNIALTLRYKRTHVERRETDVFDPERDWATSERCGVSDGVSPNCSRYLTASVYAAM